MVFYSAKTMFCCNIIGVFAIFKTVMFIGGNTQTRLAVIFNALPKRMCVFWEIKDG